MCQGAKHGDCHTYIHRGEHVPTSTITRSELEFITSGVTGNGGIELGSETGPLRASLLAMPRTTGCPPKHTFAEPNREAEGVREAPTRQSRPRCFSRNSPRVPIHTAKPLASRASVCERRLLYELLGIYCSSEMVIRNRLATGCSSTIAGMNFQLAVERFTESKAALFLPRTFTDRTLPAKSTTRSTRSFPRKAPPPAGG